MSKGLIKTLIVIVTVILIFMLGVAKQAGLIPIVGILGVAVFNIARSAWKATDKKDDSDNSCQKHS